MNDQQEGRLIGAGRAWVYKVRADAPAYAQASGEWLDFFKDDVSVWGGSWATRNAESHRNFCELRPGDRIWAYQSQSDEPRWSRVIVGLTEVVAVTASMQWPGESDLILRRVIQLTSGLRIHDLRRDHPILRTASAFLPGHSGTLYDLQPAEHRAILDLCDQHRLLPNSKSAGQGKASGSITSTELGEADPQICEVVKEPGGGPAAGVEVYLEGDEDTYWHGVTTDEQGRFVIEVRQDDRIRAALLLDPQHHWSPRRLDVGLLLGASPHRHRADDLWLQPTVEVGGRILDAEGRPCAGMFVTAVPQRRRPRFEHGVIQTVTSAEGRFLLSGVWRETVMIEVAAPDRLEEFLSTPVDASLVHTLELQLPRRFSLGIEVRDPDGRAIDGAGVWVGSDETGTSRLMVTDANGRATFENLVSGRHLVGIEAPDVRLAQTNLEVEVPHQQQVAVSLRPTCAITGVVVGPDQRPSPDARVQLVGFLDPEDASAAMPMTAETTTDAQGLFTLEGLSTRSNLLSIVGTGEHERLGCHLRDVESGTRDLRVVLRPDPEDAATP